MMEKRLENQIAFLLEADKMKSIYRKTMLIDKSRQENDAEHSWHLALMAILLREYAEPGVNTDRVIKMVIVHDLIEIYAGDTFAYDSQANESKAERENEAADKLFAILPDEQTAEIRSLWEEFEEAETPDAKYAAAIDRFQPLINNYMTQGHAWREGKVTSKMIYKRMELIKQGAPGLWEYAQHIIEDSIKKGYISE